jgi:hypothetical protein
MLGLVKLWPLTAIWHVIQVQRNTYKIYGYDRTCIQKPNMDVYNVNDKNCQTQRVRFPGLKQWSKLIIPIYTCVKF